MRPVPGLSTRRLKPLVEAINAGVTRRDVLKAGALVVDAAAWPHAELAIGPGAGRKRGQKKGPRELRTYVFDLSWCDTSDHDIVLAAAKQDTTLGANITSPVQAPKGCSPCNGQLCSLDGITVNSAAADIGQSFQSYNSAAPIFPNGAYFVPLKDQPVIRYLDFAVEFKGYMFVLSIVDSGGSDVFTLEICQPTGEWLAATTGFAAQRIAVNYWRDNFAGGKLNLLIPQYLPEGWLRSLRCGLG
jgi:hypothetical protein